VSDVAEHAPNPVPERRYHWNLLSMKQFTASLAAKSQAMEIVHVHGMLFEKYGARGVFDSFLNDLNQNLFSFFVKK
jgi:hypothetical protein